MTAPRLSARDAGANAIELSWTAVSGADRYVLWTQEVAAPGWQQIDGGNLRATSYTHRDLRPGVTYQYAVRAIDGNGEPLGPWSNFPTETASGSGAPTPAAAPTAAPTPATTERGALIALYEAAGGAGWSRNGNWLSDKPLDSWHGVTTDANGRVTALDLNDNLLYGQIPDLSALSNLTHLDFSSNYLRRSIPDLSALSNLEKLYLSRNQLTGGIPDLNALPNLESLDLSSNQLTGEIPDLSALSNLRSLELSHNQLSGPIPNLSAPTSLTWLNLSHNQLNGTIFGINLLISLRTLYLSHNQLSGPLPDLGSLVSLWHLDLTGNRFCLPAGYAPSGANAVVTKNLTVIYSLPCTEAELEAIPGAPQNLAAATGAGQVTLTWDAVRDAAGYELWVWNSLDRKWEAAVGALTATTYTHSVLSDGRNYYYQVRARDAKGMRSPWSERVRAIIVPGRFPPPPVSLGLHLYYQKYLEVDKVVVVAPTEVSDETMEQARAIVSGMLSGKAGRLLENSSTTRARWR